MRSSFVRRAATVFIVLLLLVSAEEARCLVPTQEASQGQASAAGGLLNRDEAGKLLPATVFYHGQVAPVQARNSAGVRFPGSKLMLVALVDTSGYSSSVQETYQGYLIAEGPLRMGGKLLPAGAYGFGFVSGDRMVVMDVGGTEVMATATMRDGKMTRPNPLQMVADGGSSGRFRLYLGRSYVTVEAAGAGAER